MTTMMMMMADVFLLQTTFLGSTLKTDVHCHILLIYIKKYICKILNRKSEVKLQLTEFPEFPYP